jgi:hypothetical protein
VTDVVLRAVDVARAARTVVGYYTNATEQPNTYATGQATAALSVWADLTGRDMDAALTLAREIVEEARA